MTTETFTRVAVTTARELGIIDLAPNRTDIGKARLLNIAPDRCTRVSETSLAKRPQRWRDRMDVVAMDGFIGFKTAAEELPDAVPVSRPFPQQRVNGIEIHYVVNRFTGEVDDYKFKDADK